MVVASRVTRCVYPTAANWVSALGITMRTFVTVLAVALMAGRVGAEDSPADATEAIDRALSYLAKDALAWKTDRKCASCHHAPLAIWGLNEARRLGFAADAAAADELTAWVNEASDPARVFGVAQTKEGELLTNQATLMLSLGIEAAGPPDDSTRAGLTKMLTTALETQRPDGSWGLQTNWEPIGGAPEVITSLVLLSLTSPNTPDMGQPGKDAVENGLAWLSATTAEPTLQTAALKLLLWRRLDRPQPEQEALRQRIIGLQNADGGWSQKPEMASDAYATGQSMYALIEAGLPVDDPVFSKARSFLVSSQQTDGSWVMTSSAKNLAPITFAGTAWAAMGLMSSTPRVATAAASSAAGQ
jgi:hypothetical protein